MDGLISVDEARAYAREHWPSPVVRRPLEAFLDNCPRVDAEPVRHGRWEYGSAYCVCSECGEIPECFEPNYCPNCGAKMDVKSDEP